MRMRDILVLVVLIGFLLVVLVVGYICYPFFASKPNQRTYTQAELELIGEEIEREILALRKYPGTSQN